MAHKITVMKKQPKFKQKCWKNNKFLFTVRRDDSEKKSHECC